jgi:hypothetical protein
MDKKTFKHILRLLVVLGIEIVELPADAMRAE